jgi:hypothetical protein
MRTSEITRRVAGSPCEVAALVDAVVAAAWDGPWTRRWAVGEETGSWRTDGVAAAPDADGPDVWVSWRLEPACGATLVTVQLDELDPGTDDPTDGLNELLDALTVRAVAASTRRITNDLERP